MTLDELIKALEVDERVDFEVFGEMVIVTVKEGRRGTGCLLKPHEDGLYYIKEMERYVDF